MSYAKRFFACIPFGTVCKPVVAGAAKERSCHMFDEDIPTGWVEAENNDELRGKLKGRFEAAISGLSDIGSTFENAGYRDARLNERFEQLLTLLDETGRAILSAPPSHSRRGRPTEP